MKFSCGCEFSNIFGSSPAPEGHENATTQDSVVGQPIPIIRSNTNSRPNLRQTHQCQGAASGAQTFYNSNWRSGGGISDDDEMDDLD